MQRNVECRDTYKQAHLHTNKQEAAGDGGFVVRLSFEMWGRNLGAPIYYVLFDCMRMKCEQLTQAQQVADECLKFALWSMIFSFVTFIFFILSYENGMVTAVPCGFQFRVCSYVNFPQCD